MTLLETEAQLGISALKPNVLAAYFDVSSFAMLIYDHALTMGLEISLVWPAPWNLGKAFYFLIAYMAFAESSMVLFMDRPGGIASSLHTCTRVFKARIWMLSCGISLAEAVLVYRTWAIWGRTRKLAVIFSAAWTAIQVAIFIVADLSLEPVQFIPRPSPRSINCVLLHSVGAIAFVDYLLLAVVESTILGLTLYIIRRNLRRSSSTLYMTLYRDGILFYAYLFGFSVVNIITIIVTPNLTPLIPIHRMLHAVLIKRILLNLRNAAWKDDANLSPSTPFITDMSFASRDQQSITAQHDEAFEMTHRTRRMSANQNNESLNAMHRSLGMSADQS